MKYGYIEKKVADEMYTVMRDDQCCDTKVEMFDNKEEAIEYAKEMAKPDGQTFNVWETTWTNHGYEYLGIIFTA